MEIEENIKILDMKYKFLVAISMIILLAISCEKNEIVLEGIPDDLIGSWIEPEYNDTLVSYRRVPELEEGKAGFTLQEDGSMIDRKNSGSCATPPIAYADYYGTWTISDSIIDISIGFWGGEVLLKWKIISVTEDEFTFAIIKRENIYQE